MASFLDLPAEIRNRIYECYFDANLTFTRAPEGLEPPNTGETEVVELPRTDFSFNLRLTCLQIYIETHGMWAPQVHLHFLHPRFMFMKFLEMEKRDVKNLRRITVSNLDSFDPKLFGFPSLDLDPTSRAARLERTGYGLAFSLEQTNNLNLDELTVVETHLPSTSVGIQNPYSRVDDVFEDLLRHSEGWKKLFFNTSLSVRLLTVGIVPPSLPIGYPQRFTNWLLERDGDDSGAFVELFDVGLPATEAEEVFEEDDDQADEADDATEAMDITDETETATDVPIQTWRRLPIQPVRDLLDASEIDDERVEAFDPLDPRNMLIVATRGKKQA